LARRGAGGTRTVPPRVPDHAAERPLRGRPAPPPRPARGRPDRPPRLRPGAGGGSPRARGGGGRVRPSKPLAHTRPGVRVTTYAEAIRHALARAMRADERVFVLGEDVSVGGPFTVTRGLADEFGRERVR